MPDEPLVTRREMDLMKVAADVEHAKIWVKIDALDEHGSRGMGILQARVDSLIAAVADLKVALAAHEKDHEVDARDRVTARRWLVGTGLVATSVLGGLLGTILYFVTTIRGH